MRGGRWAPVLALTLLAACGDGPMDNIVCAGVIEPALLVEVVDAATGANLVPGAEGRWVSGQETGTLDDVDFSSRFLVGYGPAGRYGVIVEHAGYAAWGRDDVRVNAGRCGPETVSLRAELVRTAGTAEAGVRGH